MEGQARKRIRSFLLAGLVFLAGQSILISGSSVSGGTVPITGALPPGTGLSFVREADLEEGDVLLRRGKGFVSSLIAGISAGGVSHCGVVVRDGERWLVIHSISGHLSEHDGIRSNSLEEFAGEAQPGSLYHLKPRLEIDRKAIAERSKELLTRKVAFDHSFDLEDDSQLYCSELVRCVYLHGGLPDLFSYTYLGDKKIIDMKSFFDPRLFVLM